MTADAEETKTSIAGSVLELVRSPRTNIRGTGLPFIGRDEELETLRRWLDEGRRLVTLTGAPGVGKTRLARRLGELWLNGAWARSGDLWFVDLSEARALDELITSVADVLGVPLTESQASSAAATRLGEALRYRGFVLLVCDNVEQVVELAATCFSTWLAATDRLQIVVTSRERLALGEEFVLELTPLSVPNLDLPSIEAVLDSEAGQLFVERVRAVRPEYRLTNRDAPVVANLLDRLDGVPLSIELAAARMNLLAPEQLLMRIEQQLQLLSHGRRGAPSRHASLEAAISWSWDLLEPWERSALEQCAVFHRGFDAEAVEAMVDLSQDEGAPEALDVLQSLRDKSLVALDVVGRSGRGLRYRLLESIRAFADSRLGETDWCEAVRDRHAAHFAFLGESWAQACDGETGVAILERLPMERDNLVAAFEHVQRRCRLSDDGREGSDPADVRDRHAAHGLRLALALDLLLLQGPVADHLRLLEASLEVVRSVENPSVDLQIEVMLRKAGALIKGGRLVEAADGLHETLELARRHELGRLEGRALTRLAAVRIGLNDTGKALEAAQTALRIGQALADEALIGRAKLTLASLASLSGDRDETTRQLTAALNAFTLADDQVGKLWVLTHLGDLFMEMGLPGKALGVLREGLDIAQRRAHRMSQGCLLQELGRCLVVLGRPNEAKVCADDALRTNRELGYATQEGITLGHLGVIALERDEPRQALERLEDATSTLEASFPVMVAQFLPSMSDAQDRLGQSDRARESLVRAIEASSDANHDHLTAILWAKLGAFDAARGAIDDVESAFRACEDAAVNIEDAATALSIALYRAQSSLSREQQSTGNRRSKISSNARREAICRLASAWETGPGDEEHPWGSPPPTCRWYQVRMAARSLEEQLTPIERALAHAQAIDPNGCAVLATEDGRFLRAPGADWVDLSAKPQLATGMALLIDRRRHCPDRPVTPDELREVLWPNERMLPEAFTNRLHKTIAVLRRLGLRETLVRAELGYYLDPNVPLILARQN